MKEAHKYLMTFTRDEFESLQSLAEGQNETVASIIRKCIKVGLVVFASQKRGGVVSVKEGSNTHEITLL